MIDAVEYMTEFYELTVENFGEDYHLWDGEEYPARRMLDAMSKWWTAIHDR